MGQEAPASAKSPQQEEVWAPGSREGRPGRPSLRKNRLPRGEASGGGCLGKSLGGGEAEMSLSFPPGHMQRAGQEAPGRGKSGGGRSADRPPGPHRSGRA